MLTGPHTDRHPSSYTFMLSIIFDVLLKISGEAVVGALVALTIWSVVCQLLTKAATPAPAPRAARTMRLTAPDNLAPNVIQGSPNVPRGQRSGPPITMAAGAHSFSIVVGSRSSISDPDVDSKQELERLCERVKRRGGVMVEAELQHGAFGPTGFHLLGDHVAALAACISPDRWNDVTIRFPIEASTLPQSLYEGDMIEAKNLEHLFWTGHREQLTNSFFPFTKATLVHLTCLVLHSTISIHVACPSLTDFMMYGLGEVEDALVNLDRSDKLTLELHHLERLTISSTTDINGLLWNFTYPELKDIDLVLNYRNPLPQDLPWKDFGKLEKVKIRARDMRPRDSNQVKGQCPPHVTPDIPIGWE
ncbi:hypothetical protein Hypma_005014 [Hypsizygus marmoreus]|uniref:Uncharacterized protein n=1 Tax=Hypsizygus marmoreus TaxID=39966 RepID=A0A369K2D5_HYPMA|nr:hypothetical protein Hypma_005014 [Hypsizygus marmoreus]